MVFGVVWMFIDDEIKSVVIQFSMLPLQQPWSHERLQNMKYQTILPSAELLSRLQNKNWK